MFTRLSDDEQRRLGAPDLPSAENKGGFGFHPLFCFADATGETLSALLRPGNAGSNTVADHICVLDDAIAQLPAPIAAGHHEGDSSDLVERDIIMRADSAGCTEDFLAACRARNVGFYVSARRNTQVTAAIFDAIGIEEVWLPALAQDGELKEGAAVAELTSLIDGVKFPSRTRLIVRREPLHPGAQRSLFPSLDYRYWGFYTDQDGDPRELDATMRAHAHVESHIQRLKDSGLCRFPFASFEANTPWLMTSCAGSSCCASTDPGPTPDPRHSAGGSSTLRGGSCTGHARASCASSTAGPPPRCSSMPTNASPSSPDRLRAPREAAPG